MERTMEVKEPFEKDKLTEEEIISVATSNNKYPLDKHKAEYWMIKDYQEEQSLKGKTMDDIIGRFW